MGSHVRPIWWAILLAALALTSCATLRSWFGLGPSAPPEYPRPDAGLPWPKIDAGVAAAPVWIEGPMLRALSVALEDMTSRHREPPPSASTLTTEIYRCLARIDSWDAQVVYDDA